MEHGNTDGTEGYEEEQHQIGRSDSYQRHEYCGQKRPSENEEAGFIVIRDVSCRWLDHEGKEAAEPRHKADLSQSEPEFVDEKGKERGEEGSIEIPCEVNKRQGKDDFGIGFHGTLSMLGPAMEREQFNPMLVEVKGIFVVRRRVDYSGRSWNRYLELTDRNNFFIFHPDLKEFRRFGCRRVITIR